jgi:hypothetical protein
MNDLMKHFNSFPKNEKILKQQSIPLRASSVCGASQVTGPTFDCQTSLYGYLNSSDSITLSTVPPTSIG